MSGWLNRGMTVTTEPMGMTGWRSEPVVVPTEQLGLTGWGSEPIVVTTQPLGMTGWRSEPIVTVTPPLGMTGWRSDLAITTPTLGMTGWRREPIVATTQPLGMTGWRREPDTTPPPAIVCLGGRVVSLAANPGATRYSCACPTGRTAQAVGSGYQNTFQCIPDTVVVPPPPKIACIGGTVRSGKCVCTAGKTPKLTQYAISGNAPSYRCEDIAPKRVSPQPRIVCTGGSVRNDLCVCPLGAAPVKTGATSFRCQRVEILPPVVTPKSVAPTRTLPPKRVTPQPKIACAGGVVRSNVCICPGGTSLQNGACRPVSSVPLRSNKVPQRVR